MEAHGHSSAVCTGCHSVFALAPEPVLALKDLPVQGTQVILRLHLGRWRCRNDGCERRMFTWIPTTSWLTPKGKCSKLSLSEFLAHYLAAFTCAVDFWGYLSHCRWHQLLAHFGARRWIARIMFSWGIMSGAMAFVGGETGFYVARSAGRGGSRFPSRHDLLPNAVVPAAYRARVVGYFMAAIPLSTVIGAPVSGALLGLNGVLGMHGWQWLFWKRCRRSCCRWLSCFISPTSPLTPPSRDPRQTKFGKTPLLFGRGLPVLRREQVALTLVCDNEYLRCKHRLDSCPIASKQDSGR